MTIDERFATHARKWGVKIDEIRTTETSQLGFGTHDGRPVVLKVIRKENGEEWRCGDVLAAFRGEGMIRPIEYTAGAVLLPRLHPGHDLTLLCLEGRDDDATEVIASLLQRMSSAPAHLDGVSTVDRLQPEFEQFRGGAKGFIRPDYVDRAEVLFAELCATQRNARLLHGDLHHYNILFDAAAGWVVVDPWGVVGEVEFEIGASLRNPIDAPHLLSDPAAIERRLRRYESTLRLDADRALKWAFAMTVLAILGPFDESAGIDIRAPFADAARSMHELLGSTLH
jgi:streptomycin 6-kinase